MLKELLGPPAEVSHTRCRAGGCEQGPLLGPEGALCGPPSWLLVALVSAFMVVWHLHILLNHGPP